MKDIHFKCVTHAGGKSQKAYEEEYGAQLTHYKPLTHETDIQPPSVSFTDNDGQQSTSQSARLSTGSVDSGVGRSSTHNSYSKLSHAEDTGELASSTAQRILVHESGNTTTYVPSTGTDTSYLEGVVTKMAMKINQSVSEFGTSLGKNVKELTDRVRTLELQIQMLQREVTLLNGSSVETSESTPNQSSCTSPSLDSLETEQTPDMPTVNTQSQPYTRTAAKDRLYSDSKMTRDRKFEIKRKQLESSRPRAFTAIDESSTIQMLVSKQTISEEVPGDHSSSQPRFVSVCHAMHL